MCHRCLEILGDEYRRLLRLLELLLLLVQRLFFLLLCFLQVLLSELAHFPLKFKLFFDFTNFVIVVESFLLQTDNFVVFLFQEGVLLLVLVLRLHQLGLNVLAVLGGVILLLLHGCQDPLIIVDDSLHLLVLLLFKVLDVEVVLPGPLILVELQVSERVLMRLHLGLQLLLLLLHLLHLSVHFVVAGLGFLQLFLLLLHDPHVLRVKITQVLTVLRLFRLLVFHLALGLLVRAVAIRGRCLLAADGGTLSFT